MLNVRKGQLIHTLFQAPLSYIRMCLRPGTPPYWDKEPWQFVLNLSPHEGLSFPVSDWMYVPLLCLSMGVIWHLANHCYICPLWGGDRVLLLQHKRGPCAPTVLRRLLRGACWPPGTDALLWSWSCGVSSLCGKSIVPFSARLCCVFLGISDTKIQWAKVLGCLLLVTDNRYHCLPLKINKITNYGRKGRGKEKGKKEHQVAVVTGQVRKREDLNQDTEMKDAGLKTV